MRRLPRAFLLPFLLPLPALASTTTDTVSELAGLFYVVAGLMLTAALLLMIGGMLLWYARLGTYPTHRDEAIHIMEWGVATLFTLVLLLGAVELMQRYTGAALYIIGVAIIIFAVWAIAASGALGGGKEKEEKGEE